MLTFVPTPIGNLEDISFRAVQALKDSELIFCEDTRITKKLINLLNENLSLDIPTDKQFIALHSHNEEEFLNDQTKQYIENNNVVYLSDAGMPCISDPGAKLVSFCQKENLKYDVLPGANALLMAYAMSGFESKEFTFFGFLPHKTQNRKSELTTILQNKFPTILYESTHRIEKLIDELVEISNDRDVFVAKELTKLHQKTLKAKPSEIKKQLKELDIRGEWVVIIDNPKCNILGEAITQEDIQSLSLKPKEKAKLLAKITGKSIKEIYNTL